MTQDIPTHGGSNFSERKLLLVIFIICLGMIIFSMLVRLYRIVESSFGSELAVVVVAGATVGILFLVLVGMGFGGILEWTICKRFLIFKRKPAPGSGLELFLKIWGTKPEPSTLQTNETPSDDMPSGITMTEIEELQSITEQCRRGGKKSLHPDEAQFRAVRDWMTMQAHGTSITLQQFLEERFGVASETGVPLVPNQTFYGWRKKFLKDLEDYKQEKSKRK